MTVFCVLFDRFEKQFLQLDSFRTELVPNFLQRIDILLIHVPPKYHGDFVGDIDYDEGDGVTKQKGLNTCFVNAAMVNRDYKLVNKPFMFYIKGNRNNK